MSLIALRTTKLGDPTLTCTTASSQQGSRVISVSALCPASTTASSLRCFSYASARPETKETLLRAKSLYKRFPVMDIPMEQPLFLHC